MQTDVLIIGAGLTGTVAADVIIQGSDLKVVQLGSGSGASPYIHGFCMPVGPGDSEVLFYQDTMASGYGQCDPGLVQSLCSQAAELEAYFTGLGLELDRMEGSPRLLHALGSTVPRIASIQNDTGAVMLRRIRDRLRQSPRYTHINDQRALGLCCENGRVIGAKCYDPKKDQFYSIYAKTVVLATGGFGRLFPESTNSPDIGGDGVAMAYLAGAALTDMEFVQFEPSAAVWPPEVAGKGIVTTMFYDGAVLRGKEGNRFMLDYGENAERVPKDVQSKCICDEIRRHGASAHGGVWFDATQVPEEKWQGAYKPYLKRYLAWGIDLRKEPVEIAPAAHTTCGGVRIDEYCLSGVPGLLVCGEAAGGLHGANRLGGNAGLETMVFGRIAGKTAVAQRDSAFPIPCESEIIPNTVPDVDVKEIRARLRQTMRRSLNVIRCEQDLKQGIAEITGLLECLGDYQGCYQKHRLYNDLLTAYITMVSALERTGSVGCHCRADAVEEGENYRVVIQKDGETMKVYRVSI
ncbi:MAG: FAD-binding protein [Oscillospiraceae bacterium]|nr:FAD-binding protein [Oscillospiraceae bacterium]